MNKYTINQLVKDNMDLQAEIKRINKNHIEHILFFIKNRKSRTIDWTNIIKGFEYELEDLQ